MSSDNKPLVNIDLGAKASVEIRAEVPSASVGRFVDALTDVIRPFTEARGLRGDQIRLQRADVALEIAKRAAEIAKIGNDSINPVSNKILVPLLEKGSLEDLTDDFMLSNWATLLAKAATSSDVQPRFVSILSELTASQAKLLEGLVTRATARDDSRLADRYADFNGLIHELTEIDFEELVDKVGSKDLFAEINNLMDTRGIKIENILIMTMRSVLFPRSMAASTDETRDFNVLSSLQLVERKYLRIVRVGYGFALSYWQITPLGKDFLRCCSRSAQAILSKN